MLTHFLFVIMKPILLNFLNFKILELALLFLFLAIIQKFRQKNRRIKLLEKKRDELDEKNFELRKEASKYQSELGAATNLRLGDEDSVKFKQDILDLQKILEKYVTNLKPNMDIDIEKIQSLAQKYGCLNEVTTKNSDKPFIKALLQRKVLDDILDLFQGLSKYKDEVALEFDIELKTKELLSLIEKFSITRVGTDKVVNVAAIKVRQQVYGILGTRGFSDIIGSEGNHVHDFITSVSNNLNDMINQYRRIKDLIKKEEVEALAPKLIQDTYKLFYFRFKVQEPKTQFIFCENGSKI